MSTDRRGGNPYRRKKDAGPIDPDEAEIIEPREGEAEGPALEPGQMAQLIVDMRSGMVDRQAASAISGPLNDLAKAFAMQAEILRGVHETQQELQKAVKDDKKSEMMINSTEALNDTFRGVKGVQQRLLDELEDRGKSARSGRLVTAFIALVVIAAAIGGFLWFDGRLDAEGSKLDGQLANLRDEVVPTLRDRAERAENERDGLQAELARLRGELDEARGQVAGARGDDIAVTAELESLKRERQGWEAEKTRLDRSIEDLRGQVTFYLERYESAEKEVVRLRDDVIKRIAEGGIAALTPEKKEAANIDTPIVPDDLAAAMAARDEKPVLGGDEVAAPTIPTSTVVDDLNVLLANHRGSQAYRMESIGSVAPDALVDVVFTESAPGQGVVKRVRADRLEIVISGRGDLVEFNFKKGSVQQKRPSAGMGDWAPFYNDRYRMTVYCLNGQQWLGRSYGFFYVD